MGFRSATYANPADAPEMPAYQAVYDPATMSLLPSYEQQVAANDQGYQQMRKEALRRGPSAWAGLAKTQQAAEAKQQRENAIKASAGQAGQGMDMLAMRGGLSSGARERLAESGGTNALNMQQGINRQEGLNNLQVGLNDEQQRMQNLSALPGAENQRVNAWEGVKSKDLASVVAENQNRSQYNQHKYDQQMAAWAAAQQANATEHSGGGGCCFIFLEARYGDGTMDKVVRRFRNENVTPHNVRGYHRLSQVLVPLMRKSKLIKFAVRALMTDPLVAYGKAYYGEGSKLGYLFAPVAKFWLNAFSYLGEDHPFVRENGETV